MPYDYTQGYQFSPEITDYDLSQLPETRVDLDGTHYIDPATGTSFGFGGNGAPTGAANLLASLKRRGVLDDPSAVTRLISNSFLNPESMFVNDPVFHHMAMQYDPAAAQLMNLYNQYAEQAPPNLTPREVANYYGRLRAGLNPILNQPQTPPQAPNQVRPEGFVDPSQTAWQNDPNRMQQPQPSVNQAFMNRRRADDVSRTSASPLVNPPAHRATPDLPIDSSTKSYGGPSMANIVQNASGYSSLGNQRGDFAQNTMYGSGYSPGLSEIYKRMRLSGYR